MLDFSDKRQRRRLLDALAFLLFFIDQLITNIEKKLSLYHQIWHIQC
jgi:hypothetical protein